MINGDSIETASDIFESSAQVIEAMNDPRYAKDPAFRDVFTAIVALTSPGSQVYTNFKVASLLANEYAKTGVIPNVNPETGKLIGGPVGQNTKINLFIKKRLR